MGWPAFKLAAKNQKSSAIIFLFWPMRNFKKISSVTVFTEVVAMISSFHRLSEKKKNERKIMRTNYNCSKKISIESKVQKHSEFISILFSLAKLSSSIIFEKIKIENIYESAKEYKKKII